MDACRLKRLKGNVVSTPFVPKTFKLLPDETILPDDYPVHAMYVYIADNKFVRCMWLDGTVEEWKRKEGFKVIRRCRLFDHEGARLGDIVEE